MSSPTFRACLPGLAIVLLLLTCGCALLAKKTPTPADDLDGEALARIPPPPDKRFYLLLFGSENARRQPAYTHTWATLVTATSTPGVAEPTLEVHTISWLPATLEIHPRRFQIEPGANVELHETIRNSLRTKQEIAMWGPYEVWHGLAYRFQVQKAFLESGRVGYQCIDSIGEAARTGLGSDCIHAITDMDPALPRWGYPLAFYGQPATANVVRRIMHVPATIDAPKTQDWLIPRLGLDQYPIERREYRGRVVPFQPAY